MKVSVIVPVYNVENYLPYCIESVIQQTHQDVELLLMDDGSTDGSRDICVEYQEHYPERIKTFFLQNGGPLRARLIGVQEASGDILVFLDSDDSLRKDALSKIDMCFEKNYCDMVLYDVGISQEFSSRQIVHALKNGQIFEEANKHELYKKIIQGNIPNSVCLKAIRRECACFPEYFMDFTMRHGEDLLLSTNFITNCKKILYLDEGLYYYRDRPGSVVHTFDIQRKDSIKVVHTELEKFIDVWNMPELKHIHNSRKVRGWIDNLKLLLKNGQTLSRKELKKELHSMALDPYFRNSYENMDNSRLSSIDRILAWCLYRKLFIVMFILHTIKVILKKRHKEVSND